MKQHSVPARLSLLVFLATLVLALVGIRPAYAADEADDYVVAGSVAADGTLHLTTTISFAVGATPDELVQHLALREETGDHQYYRFEVSNIEVSADGTVLPTSIDTDRNSTVLTIDTSNAGEAPIEISYQVRGAARSGGVTGSGTDLTVVAWPVLQGLSVGVAQASGTITTPGTISSIDCESGAVSGLQPCRLWAGGTHAAPQPYFEDTGRASGEVIRLSFGMASNVVAVSEDIGTHWTLDRAFSLDARHLIVAAAVLLAGAAGVVLLYRRRGIDAPGRVAPTLIASFVPTGAGRSEFEVAAQVRPGQVGTVADERVDPVDITATLVDLAVRGHLVIVEIPADHAHVGLDWTFERAVGGDELRPYERTLMDAVAPSDGPAATVSTLAARVGPVLEALQDQLYTDVVEHGWFAKRPDDTRDWWQRFGVIDLIVAVVALGALATFTTYGLVGLSLVLVAIGVLLVSDDMPRRTSAGVGLVQGLYALSLTIQTQPIEQIAPERVFAEASEVLPYAVVLGGRERWLDAIVAADDDDLPDPDDLVWYRASGDWHLRQFPAAFDAFCTAVQGRLYQR